MFFLGVHLNVLSKEGDPPGRPYKNLYYFYERNLVLNEGTSSGFLVIRQRLSTDLSG
jgi:hypothetical protein